METEKDRIIEYLTAFDTATVNEDKLMKKLNADSEALGKLTWPRTSAWKTLARRMQDHAKELDHMNVKVTALDVPASMKKANALFARFLRLSSLTLRDDVEFLLYAESNADNAWKKARTYARKAGEAYLDWAYVLKVATHKHHVKVPFHIHAPD